MNIKDSGYCPVCKQHVPQERMTTLDGGRLCTTCKDDILEEIRQPGTSVERSRQHISAEFA